MFMSSIWTHVLNKLQLGVYLIYVLPPNSGQPVNQHEETESRVGAAVSQFIIMRNGRNQSNKCIPSKTKTSLKTC